MSELRGEISAGLRCVIASLALLIFTACGTDAPSPQVSSAGDLAVPDPDTTDMEPQVEQRLQETRREVLEHPQSAESWGRFGKAAHAHELWDEARVAYERAQELDPSDERWPYFLGDVLSVVGTDLEGATEAFVRALELRPDYAPAHMRLGRVLVARGQHEQAAVRFERALDLAADLQPARLGLAQIRLSQGELAQAEKLLDAVLAEQPRHEQALSALGQVYMRQGRREEAREIAQRARHAAVYNLFSDPLMQEVVREEASSVLLWERAKAFFDDGDYEQAARGLEQVVRRRPSNPDVHHQLGVAYGNLGRPERARHHLERVVALDASRVAPRIQLALLHLDQARPAAAIPHLQRVLELDPDDPDAGWLLGRAQILSGDLHAGLASFEAAEAAAEVAERAAPTWAHNDWANALAQSGRPQEALDHLDTTLAADPNDAQALFYSGLIHEGLGHLERAVELYCRSTAVQPDSPAAERLRALDGSC